MKDKKCKDPPPLELLTKARADFIQALEIYTTSDVLQDLAEVCHLQAMHNVQCEGHTYDKSLMDEALTFFLDATLFDQSKSSSKMYLLYGKCLSDYGEHRLAAETFKQSIEKQNIGTRFCDSFKWLTI